MTLPGRLYMIPMVVAEDTQQSVIPPHVLSAIANIRHFLVEDIRTARRYISSLKITAPVDSLQFSVLNKDTPATELPVLMAPLFEGADIGVISESGCPGIADPGAVAVDYAHRKNIQVVPLVGPSSIVLALMASGLNGQNFAFNGYLPINAADASKAILEFEKESRVKNRTQVFIETPFRNNAVFKTLLACLHAQTKLCVALDVTSPGEKIQTKTIAQWKSNPVAFPKRPAVFLFLAGNL